MSALDQFLESVEIAGLPVNIAYRAYRMDNGEGKPDMRKHLGLGTCDTCDYFFVRGDSIILIEEKQINARIENSKEKFENLCSNFIRRECMEKFMEKKIVKLMDGEKKKIRLKVYGSMLMIRLLVSRCDKFSDKTKGKKYDFWFVASDVREDDMKYLDNLESNLFKELRGTLTEAFIRNVEVLTPKVLESKLKA